MVRGQAAVRGISPTVGYKYLDHIVDIEAGDYFTMALRSDGTVYVWGKNDAAQLAQGNLVAGNAATIQPDRLDRYVPTLVEGIDGIVDLDGGKSQALALTSDGQIYTWGQTWNYHDYPCLALQDP